ncbi:MAG: acyltransferase, partial [Spirochaetaceae bacterium]|nr:acyltransferase [Spirochaetaceae bacterium]
MKKPFARPVIQALPAIAAGDPGVSPFTLSVGRLAGRTYLRSFIGGAKIRLEDTGPFAAAFERALSGRSRCIIALRHQNGWEPQTLMWYVITGFAGAARRRGVTFPQRPSLTFVHGYEVLRWGGPLARWLLPRIGAIPVHHTKLDSRGMARIYRALETGPYPLVIAPEGQVSYTLSMPPRIESGAARIGLTVAERLRSSGADAAVEILPVALYPRYGERGWRGVEALTAQVEGLCGITGRGDLRERFLRLREAILGANEVRYGLLPQGDFPSRLDGVIEAALARTADILGIPRTDP